MTAVRNRQTNKETMVDAVRRLESRLFVGRKAERTLFLHHLLDESTEKRILNVYGPGGVGKSSLLDEFRRLVKKAGWLYLYLDSRDIPRPPDGLSEEVLAAFHAAPPERRLVLALDTYEEMGDLDRWLRERFLPGLPSRVLVVIAGRLPLQGAWRASPAWRQLIHPLPLEGFDLPLTRQYLERCGIQDEAVVRDTWAFTLGHPLALSLAAALAQENSSPGLATLGRAEAVRELARCWLREVPDEELRALVEAAAVVRRFDQEILGHLTGRPVSAAEFDRLTALSFSRLGQEGWALHDLVRAVIAREVRWRTPGRYASLWRQGVSWYRQRIFSSAEPGRSLALAELFYILGDAMVRATFFSDPSDGGLYVETAGPADLPALREYFAEWAAAARKVEGESRVDFLDQDTETRYVHVVSAEHNRKEPEMIDLAALLGLGPGVIRMCKNPDDQVVGISIIIPIHRRTLGYLSSQPVTGPYFRRLSSAQLAEYATPEEAPSAWFIRLLDVRDPADWAARAAIMRDLLPLLLRGGRVLASTPLPFYQELLRRFGFEEVPGAGHFAYGPETPSPTYLLDLRGPRLTAYFDQLAKSVGDTVSPELPADTFGLTAREREVAQMVLAGLSNAKIAAQLVVTEVTVKKHLTRVFEKTGVSSRTQLMRKMMSVRGSS